MVAVAPALSGRHPQRHLILQHGDLMAWTGNYFNFFTRQCQYNGKRVERRTIVQRQATKAHGGDTRLVTKTRDTEA